MSFNGKPQPTAKASCRVDDVELTAREFRGINGVQQLLRESEPWIVRDPLAKTIVENEDLCFENSHQKLHSLPLFPSALLALTRAQPSRVPTTVPVVEITAKRFAFSPDKITLKKGQTVKLRLHSEDVTHGFFLRPLKLDEEIPAGQTDEVTITPDTRGHIHDDLRSLLRRQSRQHEHDDRGGVVVPKPVAFVAAGDLRVTAVVAMTACCYLTACQVRHRAGSRPDSWKVRSVVSQSAGGLIQPVSRRAKKTSMRASAISPRTAWFATGSTARIRECHLLTRWRRRCRR